MTDLLIPTSPAPVPNGDALRTARSRLRLTQQQMADQLGISKRAIEEYESGRRPTPELVLQALTDVSMKAALKRRDPHAVSEDVGNLAEGLARLRAMALLGDKTNGWIVFVGQGEVLGAKADYTWAVAADRWEDALKIIGDRQPKPRTGEFHILGRLSQFTIAQLGLKVGDACPL